MIAEAVALCPEYYVPSLSENGEYVDASYVSVPVVGIRCPCCKRLYTTRQKFVQHTKCKRHALWLAQLNRERSNYYRLCIEQEQTIRQQRLLIAQMQHIIDSGRSNPRVDNLIDFGA